MKSEWTGDEPRGDEHKSKECQSCAFSTPKLHRCVNNDIAARRVGPVSWLCDICYCTMAGNAYQYPGSRTGDTTELYQLIAYTGNLILKAIEDKK